MIFLSVVFIACLVVFFVDVAYSDGGMVFAGIWSAVSFFVMCAVGLALAVHGL